MSYCNIPHNLLNSIHIDGVIMVMNMKIMQYHHDMFLTGSKQEIIYFIKKM